MTLADTSDATFAADVLAASGPVLVDFWAPWCGPCRQVAPVLEQIAAAHPALKVVKVNIDENPGVASRSGVTGVPTLSVYVGGEVQRQIVGAHPRRVLERELEPYLG